MKQILSRLLIPILVAIGTCLYIYFAPTMDGDARPGDVSSFRSAFGQLALICFVLYLGIYFVLAKIIHWFQFPWYLTYAAHVVAVVLGYWLLYATMDNIAHHGFPMFI